MNKNIIQIFGALIAVALSTVSVQAASDTWSGSVNGIWDTSTFNWNSGASAFTSGDDALFTGTPANNVTAATGLTIGAITLDNTFFGSVALTGNNTMSAATTISGGILSLATATGLGTSAITVNSPGTLALNASTTADITYANTVAGAGKVQFLYSATGGHDIFLNNLGSFTGTIELSLGSGQASTAGKARLYGATLSGTSSLIIDSGTQLYMGGGNVTLAGIQVQGTGNSEGRGAIRAQTGTLAGPISLMADTTIGPEGGTISGNISSGASGTQTLTLGTTASTGNLTLSGNLGGGTGTIALTKTAAGTLTLSGASTFDGGVTLNAGTLSVGASSTPTSGTVTSGPLGTGTLTLNGGTLQNPGGYTIANNISVGSSGGTIKLGSANNFTLTGALSGGGNLTIAPAGGPLASLYLNFSANTASGTITIANSSGNNQTVTRFNSTTSGSATAAWSIGGAQDRGTTLDFTGTIEFGSLSGSGLIQGDVPGIHTLSVGALNTTTTFSGVIKDTVGTVALTKVGTGMLTLSGANTYNGDTTISAGTLTIGGAGKLGGGNYSGAIINNGIFNYSSSAAQTLSGPISGSGNLTNNGSLTLSGPSISCNLIANAGTLLLSSPQSFAANTVSVNDGAALNETYLPSVQMTVPSLTVGSSTGATNAFVANSTSLARISAGTLTLNGVNTFNIIGGNLAAGSSYPLIAYTTLAGSGSYALGVLPAGVAGNLSTNSNTIYFNVTGVTNTVWSGAVNGTWDINTTANWTNTGTLGNTYINGSPVQFDDTGLNTTTISNSTATTLSPISVLVTNNTQNYCFKANTIIAGNASLTKTGTANLTNSTPNTYTGSTIINQGQLVAGVASVANTSGALGNNSAVTLANDATAILNLNGFATQIGSLSGGGLTGGNVALGSAILTLRADNTSSTYAGIVSGTGGLTKIGTGTLTLNGANLYTGTTLISQGKLVVNGNGMLGAPGAGYIRVGNTTGQAGAMYQSGVNTVVSNSTAGGFNIASAAGAYGYYNLASGTINSLSEIDPANGGAGDFAQFDMSGGTVNISSNNPYFLPCRNGAGESSVVNISGGTLQIAGGGTPADGLFNGLSVNWGNTGAANTNTTTISGNAQFLFPSLRTKLNVGSTYTGVSGNSANVCALNLNGGVFQTLGFLNGAANNPNVNINFNGGTLKAGTAANAAYMSGLGGLYVYGNGGTFDNNGLAIGIGQTLSSPSGSGVASIAVGTAGSGYIVPPQVTITGSGTGATAYSTIDPVSGAVTGIIVTCPGMNYSSPTVTLAGGGGSGATAGAVTLAANTSGPLTFTGAGITTLTGAYSVTGGLNILGGTLVMNTANGVPSGGDLTVSNATFALDSTSGSPLTANNVSAKSGAILNLMLHPNANGISASGNLFLGTNVTLNLSYNGGATLTANPLAAALNTSGSLTKGTNIVINISAGGLSVGVFPLITTGAAVTTNNFTLGTLPPGIKAVLTNNTANSLDLLITGAGQLLIWHGANIDNSVVLTNWDINTSSNWYDTSFNLTKYLQYSGNSYGDNVTFGDSGYNTDGTNHVYLPANVVPATVTYSAAAPYVIAGPGGIGGTAYLLLTNATGVFNLNTSNSYTGGTFIGGGTLVITNDNALGNSAVGVTLSGGTLQLNSPITSSRSVSLTANSSVGVTTNVSAQLSAGVNGSGMLTKTDNGTLTLAGSSLFGKTVVGQGTLNLPGALTNTSAVTVGTVAGYNVNLNLSGNLVATNLFVGNISGVNASVVQTGGNSFFGSGGGDAVSVGNIYGAYGYYNAAGGTLTANGIAVGGENNTGVGNPSSTGGNGLMDINNGAAVNDIGWLVMSRGTAAELGVLNVYSGGSLAFAGGGLVCNWGTGQTSIINVMGGSVTSTNQGVNFRTAGDIGILNLDGGVLQGTAVSGSGILNFNGGVLKAAANSSAFVNLTRANVYSNGGTIDDGGYALTINQPLLAPVGYGVSTITVSADSSGYVVPPIVTITGGAGSNATAIATISGGQVATITVTSPGNGYASGDAGSMSLAFTGGGASATAPSTSTFTLASNTSGGLTKLGNGTLTLTGASTYTGNTVINAGKLIVTSAHQATNAVSVADTAGYGVSLTGAPATVTNGAITLAAGTTTLSFGLGNNGNPGQPLLFCGALTNNGTLNVSVAANSSLLTVGSAIPLMHYAGGILGSLNPTIAGPRGSSMTLSNDTTGHILYAVVNSSLIGGIVWTGTNSAPGLANLWDLNSTTNWLIAGSPTDYQEIVPPGDAVTFNDLGSGTVLLSNSVSPASVTISNSAVDYTFQGTGSISGTAGLTKQGSGTVTFNVANTYNGGTTLSNGTIVLGNGTALGSGTVTLAGGTFRNGATVTMNNNVSVATNTTTIWDVQGGNFTFNGNLTGGGTITRGTGALLTLWLGGDNSGFTGTYQDQVNANAVTRFNTASAGSASARWIWNQGTSTRMSLNFGDGSINWGSMTGSGYVDQGTAGTSIIQAGALGLNDTFSGVMQEFAAGDVLAFTKVGSGTMTLSGANTYTGPTIVSNGTLNVSTVQTGGGDFTVVDGATLGVNVITNGSLKVSSLTLGSGNNCTINFTGIASTTAAAITNAGALTLAGTVTVNVPGITTVGQYPLIGSAGGISGTGGFVVGPLPVGAAATIITNGDTIIFNLTTAPASLVWSGATSTNWDFATTNWQALTVPQLYTDGLLVNFDDSATRTNVNLAATVSPLSITVSNTARDYAFTSGGGKITGSGGLTKSGSGRLTLTGMTNDFTGVLTISNGTVAVDGNANLGSTSGSINLSGTLSAAQGFTITRTVNVGPATGAGNGTLDVAPAQTLTNNNAMGNNASGTGTLVKSGSGTLRLGASSTYSGGTVVSNGILVLTTGGAVGAVRGTLTINSGASVLLTAQDALGYNNDSSRITAVNIVGGTLDDQTNANQGYRTLINLTGGTLSSTGGGQYNFTTGQTISSLASSTQSAISAPILIRDSATLAFDVAPGTVSGGIDLTDSGAINGTGCGLSKTGAGTLALGGVNTYTGTTTVSAGTLLVNGSVAGAVAVNGGILGGTGTVSNSVTVNSSGTLSPGASIGTLTINGNLTLAGNTVIELDKSLSPAQSNDVVAVSGTLNYGGTLSVTNLGPTLVAGDSFRVFKSGGTGTPAITGNAGSGLAFAFSDGVVNVVTAGPTLTSVTPNVVPGSTYPVTLSLGGSGFTGATAVLLTNTTASMGASYPLTVNSDTSISVSFVPGTAASLWNATVINGSPSAQVGFSVSMPSAVKIGGSVGLAGAGKLVLSGTNGTPGYSYVVLSTTNLNPPVVWTPIVTNVFDGSGNFAYTNTISTVTNKLFLRIEQ